MSRLAEMLQQEFMLRAFAGTALVALLCSYVGVFVVLRRAVFVGAALAQISSLGVAVALLLCGCWGESAHGELPWLAHPLAFILSVGAALVFAAQPRERRLSREAIIGIGYAAAGALVILTVAISAGAEAQAVNLLFGNVLTITWQDIYGLVALGVAVGGMHAAFFKEFLLVSFDPEMAQALGMRARRWNGLLFLTVGLTVAGTIRAAGALVVFAFLVLPAASGLLLATTLQRVLLFAVLTGLLCAVSGITISYLWDWPTGPTVVALLTAAVLVSAASRSFRQE